MDPDDGDGCCTRSPPEKIDDKVKTYESSGQVVGGRQQGSRYACMMTGRHGEHSDVVHIRMHAC